MSPQGGGTIDSIPEKNPDVAYRALSADEGGVLLHLRSGQYHGVNELGLAIWELLDGERTVAEVVEEVRARTEDAPARLGDDVLAFLESMRELDLVTG